MKTVLAALSIAVCCFSVHASDSDTVAGKSKYAICSACHGTEGQGGIGPKLAGQSSEYIVDRLRSYKAGEQIGAQSALMWGQSANLTEQDIADLAEYISSLK